MALTTTAAVVAGGMAAGGGSPATCAGSKAVACIAGWAGPGTCSAAEDGPDAVERALGTLSADGAATVVSGGEGAEVAGGQAEESGEAASNMRPVACIRRARDYGADQA